MDNLEGREHVVVPMVILTEGVHSGSQGPLYYPKDELSKTPAAWNHKPIVVYHPSINGEGISACDPVIINNRKVGVMMNTKWDKGGRLKSEAWIEKDRANTVDDRIMTAVDAKEMMELSTGVFIDIEETSGTWKSEDYTGIARNYRPDHLALLPDQIGACSIADGAGLLRNQAGRDLLENLRKDPSLKALRQALVKMGLVENEMSFSNISSALSTALRDKFNANDPNGPWIWVLDVFSNFVIYERDGKLWRLGYTAKDTGVSLDDEDPVEVMRVTEYRTTTGAFVGNTNPNAPMNKKKVVDAIIAANVGWKETDRDALMALNEDQLKLIQNVKEPPTPPAPTAKAKEKIDSLIAANVGLTEADRPQLNSFTEEQLGRISLVKSPGGTAPPAAAPAAGSPGTAPPPAAGSPPATNVVTVQDFIKQAPPQMQEVLNNSIAVYNEEKTKLIEVILANENNGFSKQELEAKGLNEIKMLARLAAKPNPDGSGRVLDYSGQAPVRTDNQAEEPLQIPILNFAKN